jgi:hypothetical protein
MSVDARRCRCPLDSRGRATSAKDRTFKTVRPNQGTTYGDDQQGVAHRGKVPAQV